MFPVISTVALEGACRWTIGADHPQRTAQAIGALRLRAGHCQPVLVDLICFTGINVDVAIRIFRVSRFNRYFLVPAMHATDGIRVDREGQVLVHAALAPEDA